MGLIHDAASANIEELVEKCLSNNVNVDVADAEHGRTALHFAAEKGHIAMVRYLLARGAKPGAIDFYGMTPVEVAEENGHKDIVALLSGKPVGPTETPQDLMYAFPCPHCGKVLRVPQRYFGTSGRCSTCSGHITLVAPPHFDEKYSKSLDETLNVVFNEALPALPFQSEAAIRRDYEPLAKVWKSTELIELTEKGLRGVLEKNLRILEWRSDFEHFHVVADMENTPAIQLMATCHEANRPVAIRIWRGSEHYYACGGLDFIPHP